MVVSTGIVVLKRRVYVYDPLVMVCMLWKVVLQ